MNHAVLSAFNDMVLNITIRLVPVIEQKAPARCACKRSFTGRAFRDHRPPITTRYTLNATAPRSQDGPNHYTFTPAESLSLISKCSNRLRRPDLPNMPSARCTRHHDPARRICDRWTTTIEKIRDLFEIHKYHHLVVHGDHNECVGVISDRDLLKNISPYLGKMNETSADRALLKRRAHQIMTRQLVAVRPNTALRAAARVMLDHRISCLPVLDQRGHCIGIVTLRDIVRWSTEAMTEPISKAA